MTRFQRISAPLLAIFCTLLLSACGFQLRNSAGVSSDLRALSVSASDRGFQRILNNTLETSGVTVSEKAPFQIVVTSLSKREQPVSVSSGSIVKDYEVTAILNWQLENEQGLVLLPAQQIRQSQTYQHRVNQYNASQTEKGFVWQQLQQDLSLSLTRKLASLSNSQLLQLTRRAEQAAKARQAQPVQKP